MPSQTPPQNNLHRRSSNATHRTDIAGTLVAAIGGPAAKVAGLVARPLPLGEMARVVAQLGCDRGLHQHVPLRVQSVPVVGGVNALVDTAMLSYIYTYIAKPEPNQVRSTHVSDMYTGMCPYAPGHQEPGHEVRALAKCHIPRKGVNDINIMHEPLCARSPQSCLEKRRLQVRVETNENPRERKGRWWGGSWWRNHLGPGGMGAGLCCGVACSRTFHKLLCMHASQCRYTH